MSARTSIPIALSFLSSLLLLPGPTRAWSNEPHEIVCEIAWQRLSQAGRELVAEIRRDATDDFPTFAQSCTWADGVRKGRGPHLSTYEYHFINVVDGASSLDIARDCPALDCVPAAVIRFASYLTLEPHGSRERQRRVWALRFLGHFVGDLHQPLHAGERGNIGGNDLDIRWFGSRSNLHSTWDGGIPRKAGLWNRTLGQQLAAGIVETEAQSWEDFNVGSWSSDAYLLAYEFAYRYADGSRVKEGDSLGQTYFDRAAPIVRKQLLKAGVRLAHLINSAADGTLSFPPLV